MVTKQKNSVLPDLDCYVPASLRDIHLSQTVVPQIAKNQQLFKEIEDAITLVPTTHKLYKADARFVSLKPKSIHLIVTSPPYWTLKKYREVEGQLGLVDNYKVFLKELDRVWRRCCRALVPGGRLICVIGDVCLSRRKNNGKHTVVPLHASTQEHLGKVGLANLAPIIWYKIANIKFEASRNTTFLGKPYEPGGIIKNDIEFIIMARKPGGYRRVTKASRLLSVISETYHKEWFQQIWTGIPGASTKAHPAPFPLQLAERLIRMFSFVGDTVLDPFMGTGTTNLAAMKWGRHSIGIEVDSTYFDIALNRLHEHANIFSRASVEIV